MRCSDELIDSLPPGLFSYSSNKAVRWRSVNEEIDKKGAGFYNKVAKFYQAKNSEATVCVPWNRSNLVEIPVCIPDDLQLGTVYGLVMRVSPKPGRRCSTKYTSAASCSTCCFTPS